MARPDAAELAGRLGRQAEAVCRHYLPNGRRRGRYWQVGDVRNNPGRSLFVRLTGPEHGHGAAGRWTDAATGQHGDLLDLIRQALGLAEFRDVAQEARAFLGLPHPEGAPHRRSAATSREAAQRLFAISSPLPGTTAATYLQGRGITALHGTESLRFHPRCYYRPDDNSPPETWPAIIAAVTDRDGNLTGVQRTWLARDGSGKAPLSTPRRAMGDLLGHAVRFGAADDVMTAGEGIETILSLRCVMPDMPMAAALSASHLAALLFPQTLRRLYIARDDDPAGYRAAAALIDRAQRVGIDAIALSSRHGDFNDDLRMLGADALRAALRVQIAPEDVERFMTVEA